MGENSGNEWFKMGENTVGVIAWRGAMGGATRGATREITKADKKNVKITAEEA
jgi:hypothetical protein